MLIVALIPLVDLSAELLTVLQDQQSVQANSKCMNLTVAKKLTLFINI